MSLNLNIYQTLAAAIVVYYVGVFLRVKISVLRKYCIPAPVVGGILFAIINCILYTQGIWKYEQDTIMQNICMMLFFTSVGYTASISLIKRGGVMVLKMAIVTTVLIICQNIIGSGLAALGGVLIASHMGQVNFGIGFLAGLKAFTAAVLGGIGSIPGAMVGGLVLGLAESFTTGYFSGNYEDILAFGILILILIFRPDGILGKAKVQKV